MARTRIKICGVTRPEDAALAAALGADAVGMVFHPPAGRNVSLEAAREIIAALPAYVTPVGLFVDADAEQIRAVTAALGLRHVQLNGHEGPEFVAGLGEFRVVKAVRVEGEAFGAELARWREARGRLGLGNLVGLVLETGGTKQAGGTGVANDWARVRRHVEAGDFAGLPPLIAAGGLTPETVGEVVRAIRPYAVDVSSGVEVERGKKDAGRMEAFVAAVGH